MREYFFRGMGLIDVIVGIALMLIVFMGLFALLETSLRLSALAKAKGIATELANAQMESLRALSYASLGTVSGAPSGTIPAVATSTVGGGQYVVKTLITYVDDPADGIGNADDNRITTDYKKVKITVAYAVSGRPGSVAIVSNFAPPGVEAP